jgi:hypothetical protein
VNALGHTAYELDWSAQYHLAKAQHHFLNAYASVDDPARTATTARILAAF